jgi:hypothetical protein
MTEPQPRYTPPPPTVPPHPYPEPQQYGQHYPAYPPYSPYPQVFGPPRPGAATASSVVAFVLAALLIIAGIVLFLDATVVHAIGEESGLDLADPTAEFLFDGMLDLVAGGVLITGGVLLMARNPHGRAWLLVGVAVDVAAAMYWLSRNHGGDAALTFYAVLFAVLGVVTAALLAPPSVQRWLREGQGNGSPPSYSGR